MEHIFNNEYMEKYIPKEYYCGHRGYITFFAEELEHFIYGERENSSIYKNRTRQQRLKYINSIRDMTITEMRENMIMDFCEKLTKKVFKEFMKLYNIEEKEDTTYELLLVNHKNNEWLDDYFEIKFNNYRDNKIESKMTKGYYNKLEQMNDIHKILNCKNVPKMYRHMYFLNKVISELFPCEFRTDDKFDCLSYNTYECGREIEIG